MLAVMSQPPACPEPYSLPEAEMCVFCCLPVSNRGAANWELDVGPSNYKSSAILPPDEAVGVRTGPWGSRGGAEGAAPALPPWWVSFRHINLRL